MKFAAGPPKPAGASTCNAARKGATPHSQGAPRTSSAGPRLCEIKRELERVRKLTALACDTPALPGEGLVDQVQSLQEAFITMAGAVVSEMEDLRAAWSAAQAEREQWLSGMSALQREVTDRLLGAEQAQLRLQAEVAAVRSEVASTLNRETAQLSARALSADKDLFDVRCDLQVVRNQLSRVEAMASADLPATVLAQRLEDRRGLEAAVDGAVRAVAAGLVERHVEAAVPAAVRQSVGGVLRETLQQQAEPLREALAAVEQLRAAAMEARTDAQDAVQRAAAAEGLRPAVGALQERVASLEQLAREAGPAGASLHVARVEERLQQLAGQHSHFAVSIEEVVRALVGDMGHLTRAVRGHDTQLAQQQRHLEGTREAVARCAVVFGQLLNVPPPVPVASLSAGLSPPPAAMASPSGSSPSCWASDRT